MKDLRYPHHPLTQFILYIFSMDTFINSSMNEASRQCDETKVMTLGPYSLVLGLILNNIASRFRKDIPADLKNKIEWEGILLYRGSGLTKMQIDEYKQLIGATEERVYYIGIKETFEKFISLVGFTSTQINR